MGDDHPQLLDSGDDGLSFSFKSRSPTGDGLSSNPAAKRCLDSTPHAMTIEGKKRRVMRSPQYEEEEGSVEVSDHMLIQDEEEEDNPADVFKSPTTATLLLDQMSHPSSLQPTHETSSADLMPVDPMTLSSHPSSSSMTPRPTNKGKPAPKKPLRNRLAASTTTTTYSQFIAREKLMETVLTQQADVLTQQHKVVEEQLAMMVHERKRNAVQLDIFAEQLLLLKADNKCRQEAKGTVEDQAIKTKLLEWDLKIKKLTFEEQTFRLEENKVRFDFWKKQNRIDEGKTDGTVTGEGETDEEVAEKEKGETEEKGQKDGK